MRRWIRTAYAVVVGTLVTAYVVVPDPPRLLWTGIGLACVAAIVAGVRLHRPPWALPWWLLAAGTATFVAGDATYDILTNALGQENPFPSAADVLYLVSYPLWAGGLLLMVRARSAGSDRGALLDALVVTIGLGLLSWVFLIKPYVQDATLTWLERAFSVGYPLGDVLLLAFLARLLMGAGSRPPALRLLAVGALGLLAADVAYGLTQLNGEWSTGGPVDTGWILFYALWGAAALDPGMGSLVTPVGRLAKGLTRPRLLLLASASLVPPALLVIQAARSAVLPDTVLLDVVVIALASASVFLLVTVRLDGLIIVARGSARRERALREAGQSLASATSRDELYRASARAVLDVAGVGGHRVLLALEADGALHVVHDSGPAEPAVDVPALVRQHGEPLRGHRFVLTAAGEHPAGPVLLVPIAREGAVVGALAVAGAQAGRAGVIDAVCALAAQTLLAVESRTLIEQGEQRRSETHFRSLIQNASDVILVVDAALQVAYQTPSVQGVLGYRAEEIQGRPVAELFAPEDTAHVAYVLDRALRAGRRAMTRGEWAAERSVEWRVRHADGRVLLAEVTCRSLVDDPTVNGVVLTLHDVTDRRALEEELKHLAFHDSLTGLPNRALFLDRVGHALRRRVRDGHSLAVMLVDLDDFKLVNDTCGHAAGDALLIAVGERLRACLRAEDTAARLGGDEFAVLAEDIASEADARALADRVLAALREPYVLGDDVMAVRASIGVVTAGPDADAAELLRQADVAMYAAKDKGKGTHEVFHPALEHRMTVRLEMRRDLERGLERSEFLLHYQPVVELGSAEVSGVEALVRWQHPTRGLVLPGEFIAVVEDTDLALPLGAWVLEHAVAQVAAWHRAYPAPQPLGLSVNVAPRQLHDPAFVPMLATVLARYGFPAGALTLEITERILAGEDPQSVAAMGELRALGVRIALDDFGTGYSALGYLRRFPVDVLKIDRSFISGIERSADDRALVEAIVRLGETFGLGLVAEGIETEDQRGALVALGCTAGQGYLFSRPVPEAELAVLLADRTDRAAAGTPCASAA